MKNRGLVRRRKKEDKNSRVKLRNKYEGALKKLKVIYLLSQMLILTYRRAKVLPIATSQEDTRESKLVLILVLSKAQRLALSYYNRVLSTDYAMYYILFIYITGLLEVFLTIVTLLRSSEDYSDLITIVSDCIFKIALIFL